MSTAAGTPRPPWSLRVRLFLATSLVAAAFLGATALALEAAFARSALAAAQERLQAQVYMLLGAADPGADGDPGLPDVLPEPRLSSPGSGLYAEVLDGAGAARWRSPSALGIDLPEPPRSPPGEARFRPPAAGAQPALLVLTYGVLWELEPGRDLALTVQVAESAAILEAETGRFRRTLWSWLGSAALALLAVQGLVLAWSLTPLRRVVEELEHVEAGRRAELTGAYPRELTPLTARINGLLAHDRRQIQRHRDALADLAHGLKTPLAVLRGAADLNGAAGVPRATVRDQVERMIQTVEYRLQRAATAGRAPFATPVPLRPLLERLCASLDKVHASRGVRASIDCPAAITANADAGDLLELLGNLLDNAYKWAQTQVRVQALSTPAGLHLLIEDDGPGIPPEHLAAVRGRGVTADPERSGHGIGLAVASEVIETVYGGHLELANRPEGGLRVRIRLPARG